MPVYGSYKINDADLMSKKVFGAELTTEQINFHISRTKITEDLAPLQAVYECALRAGNDLKVAVTAWDERIRASRLGATWRPQYAFEAFYDLNQKILAFLACTRSFLDFTPQILHRVFGSASRAEKIFKDTASKHYDTHFSYRFVSAMRNYALHRDLPLATVSMRKVKTHSSEILIEYAIKRDDLLADPKLKASIKPDIAKLPESFDPLPYLFEQTDWNRNLFSSIVDCFEAEIVRCVQYVTDLRNQFRVPPDEVLVLWDRDDDSTGFNVIHEDYLSRLQSAKLTSGPISAIFMTPLPSAEHTG